MKWIVSSDPRIFVNRTHMLERLQYIQSVTDAPVTDWMITRKNSAFPRELFFCMTNDELNGTFITAHIGEVQQLCSTQEIAMNDFVIANTCIWEKSSNKQILYRMMNINKKIMLWFSKQTLNLEENYNLRQSTLLSNVGTFGFNTSLSERLLFSNRHKGFMKAISIAFDKVSPIILPQDYGSIIRDI